MPSNYSTLKTTYNKSYNDSKLGDTPPGWWGIIGSNKDQATIVNPGSAHSTAGTCNDFSSTEPKCKDRIHRERWMRKNYVSQYATHRKL